jgi:hypothetical protein
MNNATLQTLLVVLVCNFKGNIVSLGTAFLHGDLKEKIFMNLTDGLDGDTSREYLSLQKTIYDFFKVLKSYIRNWDWHRKNVALKRIRLIPAYLQSL